MDAINSLPAPMPSRLYDVLDRPAIVEKILDISSPITIFRLKMICRAADLAVQGYVERAFDINRHLEHFFDDPFSFRVLQARTNAVVSGSNALQFFDRTHYPKSDLDLYVSGTQSTLEVCQWLQKNGYNSYLIEWRLPFKEPVKSTVGTEDVEKLCKLALQDGTIDKQV